MSLKILVTGGAGYLGSTLVPELLDLGHQVTVVDNFIYKQSSLNHVCHKSNFKVVKGDVRIESVMKPLMKDADVIIPLAALVGAALATSGAVYQTVFRNPLADPYLLGAAAGAGLGAPLKVTLMLAGRW